MEKYQLLSYWVSSGRQVNPRDDHLARILDEVFISSVMRAPEVEGTLPDGISSQDRKGTYSSIENV
jgi:hypothetical protein